MAELRGSGGTVTPCLQAPMAKKQPTIWNHPDALNVVKICITDMMKSKVRNPDPQALQWRDDYLCLASEPSSKIPAHILTQAFSRRNIIDQEALATGLCLYRAGGTGETKQYPVLVLASQNPQMQSQAVNPINQKVSTADPVEHNIKKKGTRESVKGVAPPVVHKFKTNGLLESVLRCLSLILVNEQSCSQPDSLWYKILSQISSKTEKIDVEEIPEILLGPLWEVLEPSNCGGIHSILHVFQHVVFQLRISHLFLPSESSNHSQEIVIKLGNSGGEAMKIEEAIAARLRWTPRCGENEIATPRVLAVSNLCPNLAIETEVLVLDAGKSKSIHYKLSAFIVCDGRGYSSYVKDEGYYRVNGQKQRRQWKTTRSVLSGNQAFLVFVQDSASSGTYASAHSDFLSSQHSEAKDPEIGIQAISSGQLPLRTDVSATTATALKKNQIKLLTEVQSRIQVCSICHEAGTGPVQIAQCAVLNLPYNADLDVHLDHLRRYQMDAKREGLCCPARKELSQHLITCSLALQNRPQYEKYQEKSGWVFIDKLSEKLRTSTGFTHSLQSLELDLCNILHAFNKPVATATTPETKYLQYIQNRGMALMEAVKYHNGFYKKKESCLIQALQVPDTIGTSYSNQFTGKRASDLKQTKYAYLLHGMLAAGMNEMQDLVIYLPVSANERQNILQILSGLQC